MSERILIVEDEPEIARLIEFALTREGFSTCHCADGLSALQVFKDRQPDVIVLDLMLPGLDGFAVCDRIRQMSNLKDPYILMLTAKGEKIDRVNGLCAGADDYLIKPFSLPELVARIRSLLKRSLRQQQDLVYRTQHFEVNVDRCTASQNLDSGIGRSLELTTLEFKLLSTLMSQPQRVWNRTQLIDRLWGNDFFGDERVVDTHVARLRQKIESDPTNPKYIQTKLLRS
ncbi:response regulator with CheY-like receiver domain and winged-helix DNA-binding domain [Pleurocapsa sp. PCC 7327]|uniref:response regulator transcription factor n=1 Tax=Pleurocapsa sp. PCC 7327 TaxID=118163 RepID=UPI00029FB433|nr:response regulator transcription factor [Pleurocapsa sp. PCC 7327]AFY77773.1 response regulator with CheY-like receiver domain and winged-helix DNA-binding domain [Pleurocapsa sp. PCC 7327]